MANRRLHYTGIALTVSLALNLFVGGLLLGQWLDRGGAGTAQTVAGVATDSDPSVAGILAALPDDARLDAQAVFGDHAAEIRQLVAELRAAQLDAAAALAAAPFDADAAALTLNSLRGRSAALEAALHALLAEIAAGLDEADRAALAAAMFRAALDGTPLA